MLFLICVFLFFGEAVCDRHLVFVQLVHRHGDRAPLGIPYPADPFNEQYWPRGWGQLTNIGMQQLKEVGGFLRKQYAGSFVDERFNHNQIYIRSSDSDRALVSAQSFLNGFFPPKKDEKFENDLNWQPIAVHANTPEEPDPLLKPTNYSCPAYNQELKRIQTSLYKDLQKKYKNLFTFLTRAAGYNSPISVDEVATLNDINREIAHGLSQPAWVYKKWPEYDNNNTLEIVSEIGRILRNSEFDDLTLAYLRGGFLLNDWMRRAERVAGNNQTNPSKMILYSSHDGTLLALMNLLQVADGLPIPYGGTFIMELYKQNGAHYVEFYYWHNKLLSRICVGGCCNDSCSLKDFINRFGDRAIESREELDMLCDLDEAQIRRLHRLKYNVEIN